MSIRFRLLTEADVKAVLSMDDLIETMGSALQAFSTGRVAQPVRTVILINEDAFLGLMPAFARGDADASFGGASPASIRGDKSASGVRTNCTARRSSKRQELQRGLTPDRAVPRTTGVRPHRRSVRSTTPAKRSSERTSSCS